MNKYINKNAFKDNLISALFVVPTFVVIIISSVNTIILEQYGLDIYTGLPLVLSILSALTVLATAAMSVVYRKTFPTALFSVIFGLSFVCYLSISITQTTDVFNDKFFQAVMLALSLPIQSFIAFCGAVSRENVSVVSLILIGLLTAVNIFASVWTAVMIKKEKNG